MAVDDMIRETMSAVMDGEASEMDLARVLKAVDGDPEVRAYWLRLQRGASLLKTGHVPADIDVSSAVKSALIQSGSAQRSLGPLSSFAVAASVALSVVFGGQYLLENDTPGATLAQVPGGVMPIQGAVPVQARFGTQSVVQAPVRQAPVSAPIRSTTSKVYEQLSKERFERFGIEHAQMTAAMQPNGLVPFARVPSRVE